MHNTCAQEYATRTGGPAIRRDSRVLRRRRVRNARHVDDPFHSFRRRVRRDRLRRGRRGRREARRLDTRGGRRPRLLPGERRRLRVELEQGNVATVVDLFGSTSTKLQFVIDASTGKASGRQPRPRALHLDFSTASRSTRRPPSPSRPLSCSPAAWCSSTQDPTLPLRHRLGQRQKSHPPNSTGASSPASRSRWTPRATSGVSDGVSGWHRPRRLGQRGVHPRRHPHGRRHQPRRARRDWHVAILEIAGATCPLRDGGGMAVAARLAFNFGSGGTAARAAAAEPRPRRPHPLTRRRPAPRARTRRCGVTPSSLNQPSPITPGSTPTTRTRPHRPTPPRSG